MWTAIACLQREEPNVICLVYTGDTDASKSEIMSKIEVRISGISIISSAYTGSLKARFSIKLDPSRLELVYLKSRYLVEDTTWKRFTLLGQSLGSIVLGHEALKAIVPDVYIGMASLTLDQRVIALRSPTQIRWVMPLHSRLSSSTQAFRSVHMYIIRQ